MDAIALALRHYRQSVIERQEREIARLRRKLQTQRSQLYFHVWRIDELYNWLGRLKKWLSQGLHMELVVHQIDQRMNFMLDGVASGGDTTDEEYMSSQSTEYPATPIYPPTTTLRPTRHEGL